MFRLTPALVAAALCFPSGPANAQLFRRAAPCPTCPNGVCQPQASPAMFLPVPASPPLKLPAAAPCPCTATSCTQGSPCPCTAGNCTCVPAQVARTTPAGCYSAAPSAGSFVEAWRPGHKLAEFVRHRPRLFQRGNGCK